MNDSWDVKYIREPGRYVSCMKINGVPLLPPLLSVECRKEMQYYKALALEVQKRIQQLQIYNEETESDFLTLTNYQTDNIGFEVIPVSSPSNVSKCIDIAPADLNNMSIQTENEHTENDRTKYEDGFESMQSDITVINNTSASDLSSPELVKQCLTFKDDLRDEVPGKIANKCMEEEVPVRDCDCQLSTEEKSDETQSQCQTTDSAKLNEDILQTLQSPKSTQSPAKNDTLFSTATTVALQSPKCNVVSPSPNPNEALHDSKSAPQTAREIPKTSAFTKSKMITGSLDNIHAESTKPVTLKLSRQRSYTVLKPCPMLLAHLEVQSITSGVDMSSICMSDSCHDLERLAKKRKGWDLETAKEKWTSMANELKRESPINMKKVIKRPTPQSLKARSRSRPDRARSANITAQKLGKYRPISAVETVGTQYHKNPTCNKEATFVSSHKTHKNETLKFPSEIRSNKSNVPAKHGVSSSRQKSPSKSPPETSGNTSDSTSPLDEKATETIKELYEKIQREQMIQMAELLEKQQREQQELQKMFEKQNDIFYRQLKAICPKSPMKIKQAWTDNFKLTKTNDDEPVSLSQLINITSMDETLMANAIDDTKRHINRSKEIIKKGKMVLNGIKKTFPHSLCPENNSSVKKLPITVCPGNRTPESINHTARTPDSLKRKATSASMPRRGSDSSGNSARTEILTHRTNDTMDDLNFTLPDDSGPEHGFGSAFEDAPKNKISAMARSVYQTRSPRPKYQRSSSVDSNIDVPIRHLHQMNDTIEFCRRSSPKAARRLKYPEKPTQKQRDAASRIVAGAKGYLVRRLMRTERVQATVQTIRDALVCALELHQDREGIRGADIDLHRRLIQQITAACYSLNDTFVTSTPRERCALIAQDRERRRTQTERQLSAGSGSQRNTPQRKTMKRTDI